MYTIRKMQGADLEAMLALRLAWLSREYGVSETTDKVRNWFGRYPDNPNAIALVASHDGNVIGYILCALMTHPAQSGTGALIDEIFVDEAHRGRGIGRQLVDRLRDQLRATVADLTTIRAQSDRGDSASQSFWASLGFEHHFLEYSDYLE